MSYTFNIPFDSDPKVLITKIKKEIAENGGIFSGNDKKGEIEINSPLGKIKGSYEVKGKEIIITITKKPLVISNKKIEEKIREYI